MSNESIRKLHKKLKYPTINQNLIILFFFIIWKYDAHFELYFDVIFINKKQMQNVIRICKLVIEPCGKRVIKLCIAGGRGPKRKFTPDRTNVFYL